MIDPVVEFDWAAHWKRLVEARQAGREGDFWSGRAPAYKRSVAGRDDILGAVLEPYLGPAKTVIDVGAGTGRHAVPLAERVDWVTAVEPSEDMRAQMEAAPNLTVIGSSWEDAEPAPADLVICNHVLYAVAEPVPFIEKMEKLARERVLICLRDAEHMHPAEQLRRELGAGARHPRFQDLFNLLRQMGVAPEVAYGRYPWRSRYAGLEEAVEDCRGRLGGAWDEGRGRAWLEERLRPGADGGLVFEGGEMVAGVAHWTPRS